MNLTKNVHVICKYPRAIGSLHISDQIFTYPSFNDVGYFCESNRIVSNIIKKNKVDLIITQDDLIYGTTGYLLAKAYKIPFCVHYLSDIIDNKLWMQNFKVRKMYNFIRKKILASANAIRVSSQKEAEKLITLGIAEKKIWNIPLNIINSQAFVSNRADSKLTNKLLRNKFDKIALFVGQLEEQNDFQMYCAAIQKVIRHFPKTLFLFIGWGTKIKEIRRRAQELSILGNLSFVGRITYAELPYYYAAAHICAFPARYIMGTGLRPAILASLCKLPVVATEVSGMREIIDDGNTGFVSPIGNSEKFAEKMCMLIGNSDTAKSMGQNGFEKTKHMLDENNILRLHQDMYTFACLNSK